MENYLIPIVLALLAASPGIYAAVNQRKEIGTAREKIIQDAMLSIINPLKARVDELEAKMKLKDERIEELERKTAEQEGEILELRRNIANRDETISRLNARIMTIEKNRRTKTDN